MRFTLPILLFLSLGVTGQKSIKFPNDSTLTSTYHIEYKEQNILYRWYDNEIDVFSKAGLIIDSINIQNKDISVICSGCYSFEKKGYSYIAKVAQTRRATIKIMNKDSILAFKEFKVINLPTAEPFFVGKSFKEDICSLGLLKQGTKLVAKIPDEIVEVESKVESFSFFVISGDKIIKGGSSNDCNLTEKMKSIIWNNLSKGDEVYFTDIIIRSGNDNVNTYRVGDLSFKIK